ncbi:MAG: AAA family ATPase, partial [Gallionella sp.]|nr:AAA family ATPase [Gallionella sp.]
MRSNTGMDQAEGLRRLLVLNQTQVITVVAGKPGVGRTSATINLAAALAYSGKDVLVLDENHAPDNLLDRLKLYAKHDLLDVAQGKCAPSEAVLTARGVSVLHTARAMREFSKLDQIEQQRLEDALTEVSCGMDVMLVDAAMPVPSKVEGLAGQAAVSSSLASGAALLVVVDATASGITESYALIKRLALENARLHFEIMVNKVTDERAAMMVFENMARVARHKLAARLEYLGYIPNDDRLKRATQLGRSVVEAFPTAVSAKFYVEFAQKLLRLPMRQDEVEGGVSRIMQ